jgi:hypothetical protein
VIERYESTGDLGTLAGIIYVLLAPWDETLTGGNHPLPQFFSLLCCEKPKMASLEQIGHWLVAFIWIARMIIYLAISEKPENEERAYQRIDPE